MVLSRDIVPAFSKTFPILYNLVDFYGLNTYAKSFVCGDKMHKYLDSCYLYHSNYNAPLVPHLNILLATLQLDAYSLCTIE